jgi:hypothetical protein
VATVHDGPLEQPVGLDEPVELGLADEVVVHALLLTGTRRPGGGRHGDPDVGPLLAHARSDRPLADRGRAGEDDEPGADG